MVDTPGFGEKIHDDVDHRALGRVMLPKRMNFRKNFKRPLTPLPLIVGKLFCTFFSENIQRSPI